MINHFVTNCSEPMRLDRYLKIIDPNLTQGLIQKALRQKQILLNGVKTSSNVRVQNGDDLTIKIRLSPIKKDEVKHKILPLGAEALAKKLLSDYLITEEADFFIINKPKGISCQGGSNISLSIADALQYLNLVSGAAQNTDELTHSAESNINGCRLVHRLDKDTSGILILAKSRFAATKLTTGFKDRIIKKEYLAVLEGMPPKKSDRIISIIAKDVATQKQRVSTTGEGDEAVTDYQLLYSSNGFSLVLFKPKTGRLHQLRVHAKQLGCPIVGDSKYNEKSEIKSELLLHAYRIILPVELFSKEICALAELPNYFKKFVESKIGILPTEKIL